MNKALLIIDMQKCLLNYKPWKINEVISNIKTLAEECRKNSIEVIYVQHENEDCDDFKHGAPLWEICDEIAPKAGEKRFYKHFN